MRYYEQKYPEVDELVMVQVRQIAEMGAYVKLVSTCSSPLPNSYPALACMYDRAMRVGLTGSLLSVISYLSDNVVGSLNMTTLKE